MKRLTTPTVSSWFNKVPEAVLSFWVIKRFGDGSARVWFTWGAVASGGLIALTYRAWRLGGNAVLTFWIGYILTRPFGAALGDLFAQAKTYGGLGIGAMCTSTIFLTVIAMLVAVEQFNVGSRMTSQANE